MTEQERKTIQINPELFKISGNMNKTRRQKEKTNKDLLRIKTKKPKNISTIKRNILKMIRNQQSENNVKPGIRASTQFQNDFNDSLNYLSNLTMDTDAKEKTQTIRRYPMIYPDLPKVDIPNDAIFITDNNEQEPMVLAPKPLIPKYGCLKNGNLPTYRTWKNQTTKNPITIPMLTSSQMEYEKKLENNIKELSRIQQIEKKENKRSSKVKVFKKTPKQKRILRRTFYVGRSKTFPKVSVLVANKTIRANTQFKSQQLKQIPINEVKSYLLKNGFIKVGTNAPNDVLREMFENAQMICGEIKNHNPENLLYNYFNDSSKEL